MYALPSIAATPNRLDFLMRSIVLLLASVVGFSAAEKTCPFCEIAAGRLEASMIWRDATVMAFLSIGPRNPGHVLVVPVQHAEGVLDLPAATAHHMFDVAQRMARAIKKTDIVAKGFTLKMNTGAAAGQSVFHAHLHVIPRFAGEPPEQPSEGKRVLKEVLEPIAAKIRAQLE